MISFALCVLAKNLVPTPKDQSCDGSTRAVNDLLDLGLVIELYPGCEKRRKR
jgi:hypothetical protein